MNLGDPRLPDRFWSKVIPEPNSGCWLWIGAQDDDGYGRFFVEGRNAYAHRIAFGAIHDAIHGEIDHRCRTRRCVNPTHLDDVSHRENVNRGRHHNREATHCIHGHPFDDANTRIDPDGKRACRACHRRWQREYQEGQRP